MSQASIHNRLRHNRRPIRNNRHHHLLSNHTTRLHTKQRNLPTTTQHSHHLHNRHPTPTTIHHHPTNNGRALPSSRQLTRTNQQRQHRHTNLTNIHHRVPSVQCYPAHRLLTTHRHLITTNQATKPIPTRELPRPCRTIIHTTRSGNFSYMPERQPNILSHNTNHNSPLSKQHRQVRQTNPYTHQASNQGQQQVSRLRSRIKERRLLTIPRKRVNHNMSHTRQRHPSLRQAVQQSDKVSKQSRQFRPMLHKAFTITNILQHTSKATQHITKDQLRLRQNQRQSNNQPTRLRSSQRRITKYTRHRRRNRAQ